MSSFKSAELIVNGKIVKVEDANSDVFLVGCSVVNSMWRYRLLRGRIGNCHLESIDFNPLLLNVLEESVPLNNLSVWSMWPVVCVDGLGYYVKFGELIKMAGIMSMGMELCAYLWVQEIITYQYLAGDQWEIGGKDWLVLGSNCNILMWWCLQWVDTECVHQVDVCCGCLWI